MPNGSASRRQFIKACGIVAVEAAVAGRAAEAQWDLGTISKQFRFARGTEGMLPCYTDYSLETTGFDFLAEVRELPDSVDVPGNNRNAFYIQGDNHSDDLFMFLKRALTPKEGIKANQAYLLSFDIRLASRSNNCIGVGGGEDSVWLKAGGSTVEPVPLLQGDYVSINVSKGDQGQGGRNLGVVGTIWNGKECPIREWVLLHKTYDHPVPIHASAGGELWIAVGVESGFEALTGVYFYSIGVSLKPVAT